MKLIERFIDALERAITPAPLEPEKDESPFTSDPIDYGWEEGHRDDFPRHRGGPW